MGGAVVSLLTVGVPWYVGSKVDVDDTGTSSFVGLGGQLGFLFTAGASPDEGGLVTSPEPVTGDSVGNSVAAGISSVSMVGKLVVGRNVSSLGILVGRVVKYGGSEDGL